MKTDLDKVRQLANRLLERQAIAKRNLKNERKELGIVQDQLSGAQEAQAIVQNIAQALQQKAHSQVASVVTKCLSAVFDDPYEFIIKFDRKRGKTEAVLSFQRNGIELDDPLNEVGGGVVDVASLACRLASILLSKPRVRRLVVLDEPFKNIRGDDNKRRARAMIIKLAEELGIQFVINTEIKEYQLGTIVEFE